MNNYRVQGSEAQLPSPKLKKSQTSGRGDSHSPLRDLFSSSTGEGGRPPSHLLSREELRGKARDRTRKESNHCVMLRARQQQVVAAAQENSKKQMVSVP